MVVSYIILYQHTGMVVSYIILYQHTGMVVSYIILKHVYLIILENIIDVDFYVHLYSQHFTHLNGIVLVYK